MQKIFLLLNFLLLVVHGIKQASAQDKFSVYGYIKDSGTGEYLIGATVYVRELSYGTATNSYGYYSLGIPKGSYTLMVSYVGYKNLEKIIMVDKNLQLDVELEVESTRIDEVVVRKEKSNANVTRPEMSMVKLEMKKIRQIPALMGEVDVIKAIQFLPGVINVAEGSSSFSVRGGAMDHNLILLDEATVYNASHFLGFFSIFNNDAIKDIKLYKGDMPASMGGRLASVLDIWM
ncbi:MAG: carboxypeptidase-like regulatory domain-containing protein [Bacteroidales bacterium]